MGIPCKTVAGHAELVSSRHRLSQRHRTLLLLVDGRRDVHEVLQLGLQAGIPRAYLDELLALGMIVMAAPMTAAIPLEERMPGLPAGTIAGPATGPASGSGSLDTIGLGPALSNTQLAGLDGHDSDVARARRDLLQALFVRAPVSGAVTMLRVRRARSREQLRALLPEVQARLARPEYLAQARQLISRVESLLSA